jgi:hypothetical protein
MMFPGLISPCTRFCLIKNCDIFSRKRASSILKSTESGFFAVNALSDVPSTHYNIRIPGELDLND